jgi:hypothetical protein
VSKKKKPRTAPTGAPAPASSRDASAAPGAPRGVRAAWLLTALLFLLFAGLPWTSCNRLGPVSAAVQLTLGRQLTAQLWGIAAALPLMLLAGVAALETSGKPYRGPGRVVAFAIVATLASEGVFILRNSFVRMNWHHGALWALRVGVLAPPVLIALWAYRRRSENAAPMASRLLAAHAAVAMPLAWAPLLDRGGATAGFLAAAALLVLAPLVPDQPAALSPRARQFLALGAALWLGVMVFVLFRGSQRPRFLRWPPPHF